MCNTLRNRWKQVGGWMKGFSRKRGWKWDVEMLAGGGRGWFWFWRRCGKKKSVQGGGETFWIRQPLLLHCLCLFLSFLYQSFKFCCQPLKVHPDRSVIESSRSSLIQANLGSTQSASLISKVTRSTVGGRKGRSDMDQEWDIKGMPHGQSWGPCGGPKDKRGWLPEAAAPVAGQARRAERHSLALLLLQTSEEKKRKKEGKGDKTTHHISTPVNHQSSRFIGMKLGKDGMFPIRRQFANLEPWTLDPRPNPTWTHIRRHIPCW